MAGRLVSLTPTTPEELEPLVLTGVIQTGRKLGEGAYGSVEELDVNGLYCAGKKLFDILIHPENDGVHNITAKFYDECRLLASLRHPNIVLFLGICFLEKKQSLSTVQLPVLVMEMMEGNLDRLLETTPNVSLSKKVSILQDVARGLIYLHSRSPTIIHRDLTARNVLLNSAMVAKIADMGNSRIVDIQPGQLAITRTKGVPGTAVYMPPEAFDVPPKYGTELDMFSFGHLALFTITQKFPGDLLPSTYQDPDSHQIKGRSEVERRREYMKILSEMMGKTHEVVQLITECLDYVPSSRPTAAETMKRLQEISSDIHDTYHSLSRLQLEVSLSEVEKKVRIEENLITQGLEATESELLREIETLNKARAVGDCSERKLSVDEFVEMEGLRYSKELGGVGGNTGESLIIVSVGDDYPSDLVVTSRIKDPNLAEKSNSIFGHLPCTVPGLYEEAAADLMATASTDMRGSAARVVQLLLDIPLMQRSKHYYLMKIKSFLKHSQEPAVVLRYMGNSEKLTGNWCFRDGTITFQELFSLHRKTSPSKVFGIKSDCNYSGQWVRECARTLDSLQIPPCGHRSREHGAMVKVFASCQADQEAAEPCYSVEAVRVREDGSIAVSAKQMTQQKSMWFNSTRLVCCRAPDSPCPLSTFHHLKWEHSVDKSRTVQLIKRREEGEVTKWYYLLLHKAGDEYHQDFLSHYTREPKSLCLNDWGYILESGEGKYPPLALQHKVTQWTCVTY